MLVDLDTGKEISTVPHAPQFEIWKNELSNEEIDQIKHELNAMISRDEIHVSSWMPGADWTGTPFQAIFEKSARQSFDAARKCFGLFVWETIMERPELWSFKKDEVGDRDFSGTVYFRVGDR